MKRNSKYAVVILSFVFLLGIALSPALLLVKTADATSHCGFPPLPACPPDTKNPGGGTGVLDPTKTDLPVNLLDTAALMNNLTGWITGAFWVLAIGFLIYAAFKYLTAQGDATKMATAKQMVIYAIIAAGIAILAYGIKTIVTSLLSGQ